MDEQKKYVEMRFLPSTIFIVFKGFIVFIAAIRTNKLILHETISKPLIEPINYYLPGVPYTYSLKLNKVT